MTFFPLDRDLLTSSMWAQGTPEQIKVWLYLLLAANPRSGVVEDADPGIALRCGLPLDVTSAALEWLAAPDQHSRTKDNDGRRIERLPDGGVRILNYTRHRDKDYSTPRWRAWRDRQREADEQTDPNAVGADANTVANDVHGHGHVHGHTETDGTAGNGAGLARPVNGNGNRPAKGAGSATERERARLEADPALAGLADAWAQAMGRPGREITVLRAAKAALAGGYQPAQLARVVELVALARREPERFPDRGSIRWAVERGKTGAAYLWRPDVLDRLVSEAEAWDRE